MARQVHHAHQDSRHCLRALSHDMSANFMLLDNSFAQLKRSLAGQTQDPWPREQGPPEILKTRIAHVEACLSESQRMLEDLARLARTGSIEMQSERVELAAVVDEVLFEQSELLSRHKIQVTVHRPLPACWLNRGRLKQVVTNLIRNAVLHGCDPQRPQITIAAPKTMPTAAGSSGRAMAALRVHDNGPGLERRLHEEVFLPGRGFAKSGVPSSGMGLTIVHEIVAHYGGSVFVDPDCQAGTAFVVLLPAAEPAPREGSPSRQVFGIPRAARGRSVPAH